MDTKEEIEYPNPRAHIRGAKLSPREDDMLGFIAVAVVVLFVLAVLSYLKLRGPALEPIEGLPMTPLQKKAWWSLGIGLALTVVIIFLLVSRGVPAYDGDPSLRLIVLGLFIGTLLASLLIDPFGLPGRSGSEADERDARVIERAPRVQTVAMMLTLAVWVTLLSVRFHETGLIPLIFVHLLFLSTMTANGLGLSVGILLGYRRMARYGEG